MCRRCPRAGSSCHKDPRLSWLFGHLTALANVGGIRIDGREFEEKREDQLRLSDQ